jgi:hypothetical protein
MDLKFRYLERTNKPRSKQTQGTDPADAIHDCGAEHTNPLAKALLSCEKKAKKKPKIDETTMFEGLQKPKLKIKKGKFNRKGVLD